MITSAMGPSQSSSVLWGFSASHAFITSAMSSMASFISSKLIIAAPWWGHPNTNGAYMSRSNGDRKLPAWRWAAAVMAVSLGVTASYGLALAGAPSPHWLWCEILEAC